MSKLYRALNVANDTELMELVESLELSDKQYVDFMSALNEDLTEDGYRLVLENLTKSWMNGSYEKLEEQYKKPPQKRTKKVEDWDYYYGDEYLGSAKIERDLKTGKGKTISMKDKDGKDEKIEEDTVYDHSWYEVKGQKYPKRTKEGVIVKEAKDVLDEPDAIEEEPVKEEKPVSTADPEIAKFIDQTEKVVDNTMNPEILQGLAASVEAKIPLATDVEQMNKLGELKAKIETKLNAATAAPVVEGYNPEDEDIFEIGDQVSFKWNLEGDTDANLTGTVREVQILGGNRYYNIASYNTEKERVENFYRVDPISNEMKKVNEPEDVAEEELDETASCGATCCGSVASFGKRFGKTAKRKNKKKIPEAIDTKLFKESIYTDTPAETVLEGHKMKYFMNEGKWYLSCDNALVKTFDKNVMIESIDEIVDGEEPSCGLLEGYSCYEMNLLMEAIDTITSEDDTGEDMKGIHLGDMMSNNQALFATSKITDLDAYEKSDEYNAATPEQKIEKDRINQEVEKEIGNEMQLIDPKSQEMKNVKLLGTKKLNNGDAIAQVQDVNSNEIENVTTPSLKKKA